MIRREFIMLLGGRMAALGARAAACDASYWFCQCRFSPRLRGSLCGLSQGLDETGYVEGDPIAECKWRDD